MRDRAALVAAAQASIDRGSKSFAAASRLFDPATRERAWLLYAWCRTCDDSADGQDHGHGMSPVEDPHARIEEMRAFTAAALAGETTGQPAFDALGLVAAECGLDPRLPFDVIDGFALDAAGWQPRSEDDLYRYCYHVAGAVGVMMARVMGVPAEDSDLLDRACDLGLAFQLANIARDIGEDAAAGRRYLPLDWLAEVDVPPDELLHPALRPRLALLGRRLADRAAQYEASARIGAAALPFRSAWAVLAAADIYGGIARTVAARGEQAWDHRVTTSRAAKLAGVARAFGQAAVRKRIARTERPAHLWTRPR
jgi:phytoene synthase